MTHWQGRAPAVRDLPGLQNLDLPGLRDHPSERALQPEGVRTARGKRGAGVGADRAAVPLRVLIIYAQPIFWSMGEGRGSAIFTLLPAAIAARGHEVRMCLPEINPAAHHPSILEPEEYHGVHLHRFATDRGFVPNSALPMGRRLLNRVDCWTRFQRWSWRTASELAAAHPPDVILGMGHYEAPIARRLARRLGVPNVTRLFGTALSLHLRSPLRFYANFPEIIAFRTPADLVVLNDDGANGEAVVRHLRLPHSRFIHLRNGVDYSIFRPGPPSEALRRRLGLRPGQTMLLTATRLAPEKKLERAIRVLRDLVQLGVDAVLVLPGDGTERVPLEETAREEGMSGRVLFPGPILQHEMPDWYRTADILLSLLDRTNAANPVFEAMACGRLVAALDAGTTRAVVKDGLTGIVLRRDELHLLAPALRDLLRDPSRRRRMEEAAARAIPDLVMDLDDRLAREVELIEGVAQAAAARNGRPGAEQPAA